MLGSGGGGAFSLTRENMLRVRAASAMVELGNSSQTSPHTSSNDSDSEVILHPFERARRAAASALSAVRGSGHVDIDSGIRTAEFEKIERNDFTDVLLRIDSFCRSKIDDVAGSSSNVHKSDIADAFATACASAACIDHEIAECEEEKEGGLEGFVEAVLAHGSLRSHHDDLRQIDSQEDDFDNRSYIRDRQHIEEWLKLATERLQMGIGIGISNVGIDLGKSSHESCIDRSTCEAERKVLVSKADELIEVDEALRTTFEADNANLVAQRVSMGDICRAPSKDLPFSDELKPLSKNVVPAKCDALAVQRTLQLLERLKSVIAALPASITSTGKSSTCSHVAKRKQSKWSDGCAQVLDQGEEIRKNLEPLRRFCLLPENEEAGLSPLSLASLPSTSSPSSPLKTEPGFDRQTLLHSCAQSLATALEKLMSVEALIERRNLDIWPKLQQSRALLVEIERELCVLNNSSSKIKSREGVHGLLVLLMHAQDRSVMAREQLRRIESRQAHFEHELALCKERHLAAIGAAKLALGKIKENWVPLAKWADKKRFTADIAALETHLADVFLSKDQLCKDAKGAIPRVLRRLEVQRMRLVSRWRCGQIWVGKLVAKYSLSASLHAFLGAIEKKGCIVNSLQLPQPPDQFAPPVRSPFASSTNKARDHFSTDCLYEQAYSRCDTEIHHILEDLENKNGVEGLQERLKAAVAPATEKSAGGKEVRMQWHGNIEDYLAISSAAVHDERSAPSRPCALSYVAVFKVFEEQLRKVVALSLKRDRVLSQLVQEKGQHRRETSTPRRVLVQEEVELAKLERGTIAFLSASMNATRGTGKHILNERGHRLIKEGLENCFDDPMSVLQTLLFTWALLKHLSNRIILSQDDDHRTTQNKWHNPLPERAAAFQALIAVASRKEAACQEKDVMEAARLNSERITAARAALPKRFAREIEEIAQEKRRLAFELRIGVGARFTSARQQAVELTQRETEVRRVFETQARELDTEWDLADKHVSFLIKARELAPAGKQQSAEFAATVLVRKAVPGHFLQFARSARLKARMSLDVPPPCRSAPPIPETSQKVSVAPSSTSNEAASSNETGEPESHQSNHGCLKDAARQSARLLIATFRSSSSDSEEELSEKEDEEEVDADEENLGVGLKEYAAEANKLSVAQAEKEFIARAFGSLETASVDVVSQDTNANPLDVAIPESMRKIPGLEDFLDRTRSHRKGPNSAKALRRRREQAKHKKGRSWNASTLLEEARYKPVTGDVYDAVARRNDVRERALNSPPPEPESTSKQHFETVLKSLEYKNRQERAEESLDVLFANEGNLWQRLIGQNSVAEEATIGSRQGLGKETIADVQIRKAMEPVLQAKASERRAKLAKQRSMFGLYGADGKVHGKSESLQTRKEARRAVETAHRDSDRQEIVRNLYFI